ncbi:F-box/kelch-repeat protein At3g23880-like [Salvia miltiorrhiza]|uniref:F-box/kelch-repeat protein At3g23880-like n=1 Tax=Salvia miltiorrhiza TaxID=226208 RepID=UPI0025ACF96F|nr:F-box/kelch-repeat protein At3g23880-like [Salvia miltiorrhiza]
METPNSRRYLHLPQELTEEILSRLAVKSLLRFRCVSKSWRCLIGSDRFIKTHLQTSSKNASLSHHRLVLQKPLKLLDDRVNILSRAPVFIVGCCNGLVCCSINPEKGRFILWNPATRISKELPQFAKDNMRWIIVTYGFGWDESNDAHKVFVVMRSHKRLVGKLYNSNTNSWKIVSEYPDFDFNLIHGKAEFVSGKLHWLRKRRGGSGGWYVADIVTFDLKSEEFGVMEIPCESTRMLSLNEGCLRVVCYNKRMPFDVFTGAHIIDLEVWVMKQDCWVKVRDVVVYEPCEILPPVAPFSALHDVEIGLVRGSTFELDDPAQDDHVLSRMIQHRMMMWKLKPFFPVNIYVESLVSPIANKRGNCA